MAHLEHRVQKVALLRVVAAHLGEKRKLPCRGGIVACVQRLLRRGHLACDGLVLQRQDVHGVALQGREHAGLEVVLAAAARDGLHHRGLGVRDALLARGAVEQRGVHVAQALHVLHLRAALDQALLRAGDLRRVHVAEVRHELAAHALQVLAGGKSAHVAREQARAAGLVRRCGRCARIGGIARVCGTVRGTGGRVLLVRGRRRRRSGAGLARDLEAGSLERFHHGREVDALDLGAPGDGHHAAHGLERHGLRDVRKAQVPHDGRHLGVVCHQVVHGAREVDRPWHYCSYLPPDTPALSVPSPCAEEVAGALRAPDGRGGAVPRLLHLQRTRYDGKNVTIVARATPVPRAFRYALGCKNLRQVHVRS